VRRNEHCRIVFMINSVEFVEIMLILLKVFNICKFDKK